MSSIQDVIHGLVKSQTEMLETVRKLSEQSMAFNAAIHSLIQTHPDIELLAADYMARMDNLTSMVAAHNGQLSPAWQINLDAMTDELNRRRQK